MIKGEIVEINFENIEYLRSGNERQRRAYKTLKKHRVMEVLEAFDPVLAGTIPINIDIESSDLDIVCCYPDKEDFIRHVQDFFGAKERFFVKEERQFNAVICNFWLDDFEIELFAQDLPVKQQNAYRHMLIEHQLISERGEAFRQEIIALKLQGYKTEPAFGIVLGLEGNPYEELLKLENK